MPDDSTKSTATPIEDPLALKEGEFYQEGVGVVNEDQYADTAEGFKASALNLGKTVLAATSPETAGTRGSLADVLSPTGGDQTMDILTKYSWTVNPRLNRSDIPYVQLIEHKVDGGQIGKQIQFYAGGITEAFSDFVGTSMGLAGPLDVYEEIFLRNPTGWRYKFPYFSKVHYDLTTTAWEKFDKVGQSVQDIGGGLSTLLGGSESKAGTITKFITDTVGFVQKGAEIALAAKYPVVGIADRPRIFTGHNEGSITIEFPLYNTFLENDWIQNREFIFLFKNQNLFNKRNFITGLPPVWYEVYIPGQYYSVASCVTNFKVENLGNMRMITDFIVPDAYQVSITLQEMAMPSSNQFQAAVNGEAKKRVKATTQTIRGEQEALQARVKEAERLAR